MSTSDKAETTRVARCDDAVEALLEHAALRPAPPSRDEKMIREAVFSEWQAVTDRSRTRTRIMRFAVAATVLLAVAVSLDFMRTEGIAPVQVASISKSFGSIYVLGEQSTLHELPDTAVVMSGQTIKTDRDSGIGLAWARGGSLRIAANTVIEFTAGDEIYLRSGRIYFDSTPSDLIASISSNSRLPSLQIQTDHGTVTHVGTQYMTYTASDKLEVSVREGDVMIEGKYHDAKVSAGQQLSLMGGARGTVLDIDRYGVAWSWIEETSPLVNTDGRSVNDFLNWVSRETGLRVEYADDATEETAKNTILKGNVNMQPRQALDFWMQSQDLTWSADEGSINVSAIDGASRR